MSTKGTNDKNQQNTKKFKTSKFVDTEIGGAIEKLQEGPAQIVGSFLTGQELTRFYLTSKKSVTHLQSLVAKKKKVAELIDLVFNRPSCAVVAEWIKDDKNKLTCDYPIALSQSIGFETYFSKQAKEKQVKRVWQIINPLKAAAVSGDNFLIRILLDSIPFKYKYEAIQQLKSVIYNDDYLISFKKLFEAFEEYKKNGTKLLMEGNRKEAIELIIKVGLAQRSLSTYALQEYCDSKVFYPRRPPIWPEEILKNEPKRSCLDRMNNEIDWDKVGAINVLIKDTHGTRLVEIENMEWEDISFWLGDYEAMHKIAWFRHSELFRIIESLEEEYKLKVTSEHIAESNMNPQKSEEDYKKMETDELRSEKLLLSK